jgi:hypothetical protein
MQGSALPPQSMLGGGKSVGGRCLRFKKIAYFQYLKRIVGFVTLINEIFLSKAQTPNTRKASKP